MLKKEYNVWALLGDGELNEGLLAAVKEAQAYKAGPVCILAKTIKGKGVSFMETTTEWHAKPPNDDQYAKAIGEVNGGGDDPYPCERGDATRFWWTAPRTWQGRFGVRKISSLSRPRLTRGRSCAS